MQVSKLNHPWRETSRGVQTIDPIVSTRGREFVAYLETLPREERQRIEAAERAYVNNAHAFTSPQQSAARDYADGMLGIKENEPADYRGFVV